MHFNYEIFWSMLAALVVYGLGKTLLSNAAALIFDDVIER
jgi:4-amino-4-deoxy-L-arabinose transferase-like glycosyltransferase